MSTTWWVAVASKSLSGRVGDSWIWCVASSSWSSKSAVTGSMVARSSAGGRDEGGGGAFASGFFGGNWFVAATMAAGVTQIGPGGSRRPSRAHSGAPARAGATAGAHPAWPSGSPPSGAASAPWRGQRPARPASPRRASPRPVSPRRCRAGGARSARRRAGPAPRPPSRARARALSTSASDAASAARRGRFSASPRSPRAHIACAMPSLSATSSGSSFRASGNPLDTHRPERYPVGRPAEKNPAGRPCPRTKETHAEGPGGGQASSAVRIPLSTGCA